MYESPVLTEIINPPEPVRSPVRLRPVGASEAVADGQNGTDGARRRRVYLQGTSTILIELRDFAPYSVNRISKKGVLET